MTAADRAAAARLIGIAPAALWCWTDADLQRALRNGIRLTAFGAQVLLPDEF